MDFIFNIILFIFWVYILVYAILLVIYSFMIEKLLKLCREEERKMKQAEGANNNETSI